MQDRIKDADMWWRSEPTVSSELRNRVETHGLHRALDMTLGFDWRSDQSNFPPKRLQVTSKIRTSAIEI